MPTAARKSATRKVIATKKIAVKKAVAKVAEPVEVEQTPEQQVREMTDLVISMIKDGALDLHFEDVANAIDDRVIKMDNEQLAAARKAAAKPIPAGSSSKLPPKPPVASTKAPTATVKPKEGQNYVLDVNGAMNGAEVTFLRWHNNGKAVVMFVTGRPGYPEGKSVAITPDVLRVVPLKRAARKVAPKKEIVPPPRPNTPKLRRRIQR